MGSEQVAKWHMSAKSNYHNSSLIHFYKMRMRTGNFGNITRLVLVLPIEHSEYSFQIYPFIALDFILAQHQTLVQLVLSITPLEHYTFSYGIQH